MYLLVFDIYTTKNKKYLKENIMEDTFNTFDFVIDEDDNIMLIMYEREGEPLKSVIKINREERSINFYRNDYDKIELEGIEDDILDRLEDEEKLSVAELSIEEDPEDTIIVYSYDADIVR